MKYKFRIPITDNDQLKMINGVMLYSPKFG